MEEETILLPCPFCGNKELEQGYADQGDYTEYWIECAKCEVIISRDTKSRAIKAWNTRAGDN